ncbi:MAG: ABC transporter substrate-binding protein [Thermoprotei archaeon]|nr:MAG: ABC transporter substrate-binding protein [Thermoprotei archaeon]
MYSRALTKIQALILIIVVVVAIVAAASWYATSVQKPVVKEVKVGVIMPLSGPVAEFAIHTRRMVEMLFEEYNAKGGIKSLGGAKLVPVWADDKGNPSEAVSEVERLITVEKVSVIFGAFTSGSTLAIAAVCEKYHVPLVVMTAFSEEITRQGYKYVFRPHVTTTPYVNYMMEFVIKKLKPKTIAHVYENSVWGATNAKVSKAWLEKNAPDVKIVLWEGYSRKPPIDLTALVLKIKEAKPDVLLVSSYLQDAIVLMKTMYELDCYVPNIIAFGAGFTDPKFIKEVGKLALGVFVACYSNYDNPRPKAQEVIKAFYNKYGYWPTGDALAAAQDFQVLVDAIEQAASPDPEKIYEALRNTNIPEEEGILYPVKFDEHGDNIYAFSYVTQIQLSKEGKLEWFTVWPEKFAVRSITTPLLPYEERLKDP